VSDPYIHASADVAASARIGADTRVWQLAQIREDVSIGDECIVGKNVYVDFGVSIGSRVKIQNNASVYHGVTIEDGVFIGPHVCFCNDMHPRAITPDGALKSADDWTVGPTLVSYGASIGAGSIILPNVTIGRFALIGAGSVVTRSVPDHGLVVGNPARLIGHVCYCGRRLESEAVEGREPIWQCAACAAANSLATTAAATATAATATTGSRS
jgi:UDP-2-acetamido-3-amino-2,3-dideoxy-glucuronate N-acetyltransferase